MVIQGLTATQVSERLGITRTQAWHDMRLAKSMWLEQFEDSRDEWAPKLLATYEWLLKELADAWQESKSGRITRIVNPDGTQLIRQEPPDPRWLSGMLAVAKETSTFLGIREGVDSVARVEVPEATRQALAPMSANDYLAMIANAGGQLSGITAVPPIDRRLQEADAMPIDVDVTDGQATA